MITRSDKRWAFTGHVLMILLSVLAIAPFLLLVISAFTDEGAAIRNGYSFFPEKFSLEAFRYLADQWQFIGQGYLVSFLVTGIGTIFGVSMGAMLGYTLSHKELPFRGLITFFVMFTMLFNGGLTSTYIIYTQVFHVKNTIFGLLLPNLLLNAYSIFMFRNYFEHSIPSALMESARIDGATEVVTFWKIVVPLSLPMIATVGLTTALMYWNDWMNGVYYLSANSKLQSIQTILNTMNENIKYLQQNNLNVDAAQSLPSVTVRMAIAVIGVAPVLCLYPIFQRWFVKGVAAGAVKG